MTKRKRLVWQDLCPGVVVGDLELLTVNEDRTEHRCRARCTTCGEGLRAPSRIILMGSCRKCAADRRAKQKLGRRYQAWTVEAITRKYRDRKRLYVVQCDCGKQELRSLTSIAHKNDCGCGAGFGKFREPLSFPRQGSVKAKTMSVDQPWDEDLESRLLVECYGPLRLDELGVIFGLSRERIRQIEEAALKKLRAMAPLNPTLAGLLAARTEFGAERQEWPEHYG